MPILSQDLATGYNDDAYDYELDGLKEVETRWQKVFEQVDIPEGDDGWKSTSVIDDGLWQRTSESEGYTAGSVIEGYTVYARTYVFTKAKCFSAKVAKNVPKMKGLIKKFSTSFGRTAQKTKEDFYSRVFNKAGMTSGDWIFDGSPESKAWTATYADMPYDNKPLINLSGNTRSSKGGGTYYNGFTYVDGNGGLTPSNLSAVLAHGRGTNSREENDTIIPAIEYDTLLVPVGTMEDTADEILQSTLVPYLSVHTKNILAGKLKRESWSYLTDTDAWFVLKAKKGLKSIRDEEPSIRVVEDELNRKVWIVGDFEVGNMIENWRYILGVNCSTA